MKQSKLITYEKASSLFFDGMKLMYGGFGGVGTPPTLIDCLIESNVRNVHLIGNDAGFPWIGIGKFIVLKRAKSLITSHIGSNPIAGDLMNVGELDIEFCPQGILVERMRAGGVGLGGILSEVGIDSMLQYDKQTILVNGNSFLIETSITADIGIVFAKKVDKLGNMIFDKTARNLNPYVAMAADITIVEAEEIVEVGELNPEEIVVPGIYTTYIVQSKGVNWKWVWEK